MARHAEIAGAGFGGLVAAIALAERGWSVRVHERTPFVRSEGFGIAVHRNGILVLQALGVFDAVRAGSMRVSHLETRDASGALTAIVPARLTYRISRQHLVNVLADAARQRGVEIVVGSHVVGAEPSGRLLLDDGRALVADVVIGADGVNSRVRDSLAIAVRRTTLQDGAMRLVFPLGHSEPPADPEQGAAAIEYWSGTRRVIWNACAADQIYVAMSNLASDSLGCAVPIDVGSWSRAFPHLASEFDRMRRSADWERVKWVRFQVLRLERWSAGRVAVLGDAAHAMPPNLGQGGGCAMMNALSLAVTLTDAADVPTALLQWEARERPLTEHTQAWSHRYSTMTTWPPWLRSLAFQASGRIGWLRRQVQRTADHVPTGATPGSADALRAPTAAAATGPTEPIRSPPSAAVSSADSPLTGRNDAAADKELT